ncbi:MAG: hypothetical protein DRP67_01010 [Candidatus Omnitrophota bacterium]|nr:MAG: hypothetical protein DRP67_01010 [Candidatus Omnitrophota bacterium]
MMEYIIDGYNVIKSSYIKKFERHSIETARNYLIQVLHKYKKRHPSVNFTVVFDGTGYFNNFNYKIKVIFSNQITADEMIRKILERRKEKEVIVVSDDKQVQLCAKILRANFLSVPEFMERIEKKKKKKKEVKEEKKIPFSKIIAIEKELIEFYGRKKIKKSG